MMTATTFRAAAVSTAAAAESRNERGRRSRSPRAGGGHGGRGARGGGTHDRLAPRLHEEGRAVLIDGHAGDALGDAVEHAPRLRREGGVDGKGLQVRAVTGTGVGEGGARRTSVPSRRHRSTSPDASRRLAADTARSARPREGDPDAANARIAGHRRPRARGVRDESSLARKTRSTRDDDDDVASTGPRPLARRASGERRKNARRGSNLIFRRGRAARARLAGRARWTTRAPLSRG